MAISVRSNTDNLSSKEYQTSSSRNSSVSGGNQSGSYSNGYRLTGGSTVSGEVISKDGNSVTLRLSNDQTINAKLDGNADINVGQRLTFEVTRSGFSQTVLRPLFSNLSSNSAISTALKAAMLPVNDTTVAFTSQMMKEGMPVNRDALIDMYKSVTTYPEAKPETVVEMEKIGIPLTNDNITQFENYKNFQHQIIEHVDNLVDGLTDMIKADFTSESSLGNTDFNFASHVIDLIKSEDLSYLNNINEADASYEANSQSLITEDSLNSDFILSDVNVRGEVSDGSESNISDASISDGNYAQYEAFNDATNNSSVNIESDKVAIPDFSVNPNLTIGYKQQQQLFNDLNELYSIAGKDSAISVPINVADILEGIREVIDNYSNGVYDEAAASKDAVSNENIEKNSDVTGGATNQKSDNSTVANGDTVVANEINKGDDELGALPTRSIKNFANQLKEFSQKILIGDKNNNEINSARIIDDSDKTVKERISARLSNILKSEGFNSILKDSLKAQMAIKPTDVSKDGKIEELYQRILRQTSRVTELMESIGKADGNVAKASANISDNVNFMNEISHYINYVQLPLKMAGQDAHGELYVYTNRKKLQDNDGNFSALLHLDMDYLGPMDVYVTMQNYTKVNTHFYLESEELLDFIECHIDELTARLTEKGYNASVNITQKDKNAPITPITEEFKKEDMDSKSGVVAKLCFDVRA